jgi:hypothetical protein
MQTEQLIQSLTAQLQPVKRMPAPALRALGWLGAAGVIGLLLVRRYANLGLFMDRLQIPHIALEWAGSSLTAITAIVVAFVLSIPGRSRHWAWLPLAPFALWLGASGIGCFNNDLGLGPLPGGESAGCFMFIAAVSVPLALALFWMLRRAHPIAPLPVALFGTLGVAATAASLLQFFHPFDATLLDLMFHLAAVGLVMLIGTTLRRPLLAAR